MRVAGGLPLGFPGRPVSCSVNASKSSAEDRLLSKWHTLNPTSLLRDNRRLSHKGKLGTQVQEREPRSALSWGLRVRV